MSNSANQNYANANQDRGSDVASETGIQFSGWTWEASTLSLVVKITNVSNQVQYLSVSQFYVQKPGQNSIPAGIINFVKGGGFETIPGMYTDWNAQLNPEDRINVSLAFQVPNSTISGYTLYMIIGATPVYITTFK